MIHLSDLSWTQFILIEIGVLFQFVAICAVVADTSHPQRRMQPKSGGVETEDHDWAAEISNQADRVEPDEKPEPSADEYHFSQINAEHLTRTAKVKFVQTFNFRGRGT